MSRRLRICYLLNTFGIGGAETVVLDLARGHDRDRFEVDVASAVEPDGDQEPEMHRRFREAGVRTHMIRQPNLRSPLALLRLFAFLRRGRYDIVHGHNRGADLWGVRLGRMAGAAQLYWTRHLVYNDMTRRQAARYRKASHACRRIIAVSDTVASYCNRVEGVAPERITTIVNGIDLAKFAPIGEDDRAAVRRSLGVAEDELMLLFVGRFSEQKAPEAFPALVRELGRRGRPVRGFMCGYGPLAEALGRIVAGGPAGVEILGLRNDVPRLLGACDLFVSTSRNEGLPLNVMEAMASAVPFAAPAIPQIRELTAGAAAFDGQLFSTPPAAGPVPERQIAEWAGSVEALLSRRAGLAVRGELGRKVISERFSLEKMVSAYEAVFLEAARR